MTNVADVTAPTQTRPAGWFYADAEPEPDATGWDGRLWPEILGYVGQSAERRVPALVEDLPPMFEVVALPESTTETPAISATQTSEQPEEPVPAVEMAVAVVEPEELVLAEAEPVSGPEHSQNEVVEVEDLVLAVVEPVSGPEHSQNEVVEPRSEARLAAEANAQSATMGHVFAVLTLVLVLVAVTLGVVL